MHRARIGLAVRAGDEELRHCRPDEQDDQTDDCDQREAPHGARLAGGTMEEIKPLEVGHVVLRVRNFARSIPFYELLGFTKVAELGLAMAFFTATGENHHDLALQAVGDGAPSPPPGSVRAFFPPPKLSPKKCCRWSTSR